MRRTTLALLAVSALAGLAHAQEQKPVPNNSVRVLVPGCAKGRIFTAYPPTADRESSSAVPEGTHLRMNGPKAVMADIKGTEGSRIEITGLMKKGQVGPEGVNIGRGVRVMPGNGGPSSPLGGGAGSPVAGQLLIDVESLRHLPGECPR